MKQPYHHGALRQALLDAAEAIIDREGIEALTLRAAAREAGVSHGAPAHHFGDLTGLLTALAATGFERLKRAVEVAGDDCGLHELGRAYVDFARTNPGVFMLMFRSERLDWTAPSLAQAGEAAFALLTRNGTDPDLPSMPATVEELIVASTRWSFMHGLATLIVDGRLNAFTDKIREADIEEVIEGVLAGASSLSQMARGDGTS